MLGQRYRNRFTLYRYAGLVVVCCERCHRLAGICRDPQGRYLGRGRPRRLRAGLSREAHP